MFINLCHSEKVAKPIAIEDPFRGGTQWEIPYSLGPAQDDKDKSMNYIGMYSLCLQGYAHPYDFHLKTNSMIYFAPQDWSMYTRSKNNNLSKVQILWSLYQTFVNYWFWQIVIRCLVGKECEVHDFIVGTETHQRAKDNKRFKQFLVQTAIEAIEKQRGLQLDPSMHAPVAIYNKYKMHILCGIWIMWKLIIATTSTKHYCKLKCDFIIIVGNLCRIFTTTIEVQRNQWNQRH